MKKVLSLILALTMIMSLVCIVNVSAATEAQIAPAAAPLVWDGTVAASFAGGKGTESDPYIIADGSHLAYLKKIVDSNGRDATSYKYFKLVNNIDLDGRELNIYLFCGTLDGNGYAISGLCKGLFGTLNPGVVSNLHIVGDGTNIDASMGILCENNTYGTIQYCSISGTFNVTSTECYGFSKNNKASGSYNVGLIQYCSVNDATFKGALDSFSLLSQYNYSKIYYCSIDNVDVQKTSAGNSSGIVGCAVGSLEDNASISNIKATNVCLDYSYGWYGYMGGLVGETSTGSTIHACSFQGEINITPTSKNGYAYLDLGGIVGLHYSGTIRCSSADAEINMWYKQGKINSNTSHAIGVFCGRQQATIEKSVSNGRITNYHAPSICEGKIYMGGFSGVISYGTYLKYIVANCGVYANASNSVAGPVCGHIVYSSYLPTKAYYNAELAGNTISGNSTFYTGTSGRKGVFDWNFLKNEIGLNEYKNKSYLSTDYTAVWNYSSTSSFPTIVTGPTSIVSYCANGVDKVPAPQITDFDSVCVIAENVATRPGYVFKEWNSKPDGTGRVFIPGTKEFVLSGFKRLYAIWEPVTPESVTLGNTKLVMKKGDTKTISATVLPDDAANKNLVWSSSDTKVATVADGIVYAAGEGVATITATTELGGISASCRVRVSAENGGICGTDAVWKIADGVLYIEGEGKINDYTAGKAPWNSRNADITRVVVGEGITEIGEFAFYNCSALKEAELPKTLATVAKGAFYKCSAFETVSYASVKRDYVAIVVEGTNTMFTDADVNYFYAGAAPSTQVVGLRTKSVEFDADVPEIEIEVYDSNASAGIAIVTEGVNSLADYTTVPGNGVTVEDSDGYRYFVVEQKNGTEQEFEIYANVNGVDYTYRVYVNFVDYLAKGSGWTLFPDGTMKITKDMAGWTTPDLVPWHEYRPLITSVEFAEGVTRISMNAFRDCTALTTVTIPVTLVLVDAWAFMNCVNLTDIYYMGYKSEMLGIALDEGNEYFNNATIHYLDVPVTNVALNTQSIELTVEETATLYATVLPQNATNKNVTWTSSDETVATVENGVVTAVGEGVATITVTTEDDGFTATCEVTVTNKVIVGPGGNQGSGTGSGSDEIASGECGDFATWKLTKEGVLTVSGSGTMKNYEAKTSPWYEHRASIEKIVVEGVTTIGEYAFNYCTNVKEVVIGEGVKIIYRNAFAYDTSLVTVYLPSTLKTINKAVFYNCSALSNVYYNGTQGGFSGITVEGTNTPFVNATKHYVINIKAPSQVLGLRTESVKYDEATNTITAVALNTNASAGVAIVVEGVASLSDYTTISGNGFTVANSGGYRYFVAKLTNGAEQSTEIYATVDGVTYTYNLEFSFVDEVKTESPIADIATLRCYEANWSDDKKTISVNVDRFPVINKSGSFGVAIIPAEGYTVTYEFTGNNSSAGKTSSFKNTNTSKYTLLSSGVNTETSGGGALGNVPMKIITKEDATRFYANVTLSNGETSVTYKLTVALRDRAVKGDVDIADILPLRADADSFVVDNEAKTITYETVAGARSAGFAVKVDNGLTKDTRPRRLLTAMSGYQLAHGDISDSNKNDYDRYVVARIGAGKTQTYEIKVHGGPDGLSYTIYTVTVVFK